MHGQAEQVWRGLPALMPQLENEEEQKINGKLVRIKRYIIAGVIEWNAQISTIQEKYDPILNLQVVGVSYGTQQSVIDDIVSDQLVLPRRLFDSSDKALALTVYDAVKVVDAVAKAVFVLASQTSQAAGQSTEEAKAPAEDYKRKFYSNVDRDFRQWLKDLEDPSDQEKLARYLRRAANEMEQEITESLPTDVLFAASRAINRYRRVVNESLKNSLLIDLHNNQKGSAAKEKEGRDGK
ncbi:type I-E CRISPR-associated protein Cse1/CasA [Arcanobacterium hippocoleae]